MNIPLYFITKSELLQWLDLLMKLGYNIFCADKFGVKVQVNDTVIKTVAIALRNVPKANGKILSCFAYVSGLYLSVDGVAKLAGWITSQKLYSTKSWQFFDF